LAEGIPCNLRFTQIPASPLRGLAWKQALPPIFGEKDPAVCAGLNVFVMYAVE
jgi:hypothetical protein